MALDFTQDYGPRAGYLGWDSFVQASDGATRPAVEIELFIKEHSLPVRKKKFSEIYTIDRQDPGSDIGLGNAVIFEGGPDALTVTISGFCKTPIDSDYVTAPSTWHYGSYHFKPKTRAGDDLAWADGLTYVEVISHYLEGRANLSAGLNMQRRDPDYFISPYGHKYNKPIVSVWEPSAVSGYVKKHNFSATLILER